VSPSRIYFAAALAAVFACSEREKSSPAAGGDRDAGDADTSGGDSVISPGCTYPIRWEPDAGAQAAAQTELDSLAPTATLEWSAARGTASRVADLNLPLDCPDGTDVWDLLWPLLDAHRPLFQIDSDEWTRPPSYTCQNVGASNDIMAFPRHHLGGAPLARDVASFVIRREAGGVVLRHFNGTHVPIAPASVATAIADCSGIDLAQARSVVMAQSFAYATYDQCAPTGDGTYSPAANDTVSLDGPSYWSWDEDATGLTLTWIQEGQLIIHPDNWTAELTASNVNCPADETGPERIYGYTLVFDAALGTIVSVLAGIGCIVC
jgi:hypothetical protein